jgi:hypothetical protein
MEMRSKSEGSDRLDRSAAFVASASTPVATV